MMGKNKQSNKQSKDETPNPNNIANREIFQRLNFLYQASAYVKSIEASVSAPLERNHVEHPSRANFQKKGRKRRQATLGELGSSYVQCMRTIGNKSVIRIDPSVKRTLCKGCNTVLLPGMTAAVRVRGSAHKGREVVYTCLACHAPRIIPAPPVAQSPALAPTLAPPSTSPMDVEPTSSFQTTLKALEAFTPSRTEILAPQLQKRKGSAPHPLPLFARSDIGHIIFRGNEIIRENQ